MLADLTVAGPDGVKAIGDFITASDSIVLVDVSNTDMMRARNVTGLFGIATCIKKNKSLKTLLLRNNGINDEDILDIGYALLNNRNIITLDVTGNIIEDKWFELNKYIHTKYHPRLPSLSTTLFRNNEIHKNPEKSSKWRCKI